MGKLHRELYLCFFIQVEYPMDFHIWIFKFLTPNDKQECWGYLALSPWVKRGFRPCLVSVSSFQKVINPVEMTPQDKTFVTLMFMNWNKILE